MFQGRSLPFLLQEGICLYSKVKVKVLGSLGLLSLFPHLSTLPPFLPSYSSPSSSFLSPPFFLSILSLCPPTPNQRGGQIDAPATTHITQVS